MEYEVGVCYLGILVPDFRPEPGVLQEQARNIPEGVAFLHGILARVVDPDAGSDGLLSGGLRLAGFRDDAGSRFRFDIDFIVSRRSRRAG